MPVVQDNKYDHGCQPHWLNLLQKHSINDLFGLNLPRGLLGKSFETSSTGSCTPPASHATNSRNSNLKNGFFQSRTIRRTYRSTSLSDCSGSGSPAVLDPLIGVGSPSSPDESSDNSTTSSPDGSLNDILNSMTLSDAFSSTGIDGIGAVGSSCGTNAGAYNHSFSNGSSCTCSSCTCSSGGISGGGGGWPYYGPVSSTPASSSSDLYELTQLQNQLYQQQQQQISSMNALKCLQLQQQQQKSPGLFNGLLNGWGGGLGMGGSGQVPQLAELNLERVARFHRTAASLYEATYAWSGVLPVRTTEPIGYSSKVFLGGVPWDISEQMLIQTFKQFGPIRVEWPGKERQATQPKGYVYIIFESEKNVKALLQCCTNDYSSNRNWYYKISSKRMKAKEVQVIPWILNDSNYTKSTSQKLDPSKTVFVGALHGMLNAHGLAKIMNDLFDGVVYAGIDTDKYKYPIGSGRVTFSNARSYMKAVAAAFIEIKTLKFTKKVQVDPYLEDSLCSMCAVQQGPYFCRDMQCFRYFCRTCWQMQHGNDLRNHKPLMRNSKNSATAFVVLPDMLF